MPAGKTLGGIFVGLSTTNWALSPGGSGPTAHTALPQRHFSARAVPGRPQLSKIAAGPSSLFPVRFNIHPPREVVAKATKILGKTAISSRPKPHIWNFQNLACQI